MPITIQSVQNPDKTIGRMTVSYSFDEKTRQFRGTGWYNKRVYRATAPTLNSLLKELKEKVIIETKMLGFAKSQAK